MNLTSLQKGTIFSLLIHGILLAVFLLYRIHLLPGAATSEIEVVSLDLKGTDELSNPDGENINDPYITPKLGSDQNNPSQNPSSGSPGNDVSFTTSRSMRDSGPTNMGRDRGETISGSFRGSDKSLYTGPEPKMAARPLEKYTDRVQSGVRGNSPFYLEGDLQDNNVLYKRLPEYPSGLLKNSKVTLQFSVLPNGTVDANSIVVIQKSDARLENASIDALQDWRFYPLIGKEVRKGRITFVYQLK